MMKPSVISSIVVLEIEMGVVCVFRNYRFFFGMLQQFHKYHETVTVQGCTLVCVLYL